MSKLCLIYCVSYYYFVPGCGSTKLFANFRDLESVISFLRAIHYKSRYLFDKVELIDYVE